MRIGLITEGRPDQSVLQNIFKGVLGDIDYRVNLLRPDLLVDETDRKLKDDAAAGGLARIKKDCEEKELFEMFFALDSNDEDVMVIQLDTAEIETFSVVRPTKKDNENYVTELRANVIQKIKEWLDSEEYDEKIIHAISIEELEAWLLALYENKDSITPMNPKKNLKRLLGKKSLNSKETYPNYHSLSKDFSKKKKLKKSCEQNESLSIFVQELEHRLLKSDEEE